MLTTFTLLLALSPAVVPAPAPVGPPTLCHPFAIGDAKSLPWGDGAFARLPDYDFKSVPQDTYDILMRSDDPFVHAETLRRAAIYLTGSMKEPSEAVEAQRRELIAKLMDELQFDADVHGAAAKAACEKACEKPATKVPADTARHWAPRAPVVGGRVCQAQSRDAALCYLDLGFFRAALRDAGLAQKDDGTQQLEAARALKPGNQAVELTTAIAMIGHDSKAVCAEGWKLLDSLAGRIDDSAPGAKVEQNLLATVGPMVGAKNHEDLVARLHERNSSK